MKKVVIVYLFTTYFLSLSSIFAQSTFIELDNKTLIAKQIVTKGTVYIVKEKVDLLGSTVSIPYGCTLKFEGGSFCNGIIVGDETYIESSLYTIFSYNLKLKGVFRASEAYPEWFESKDDAIKIRQALSVFDNVKLTAKHYYLQSVDDEGFGIVVPTGHILAGCRLANNTIKADQVINIKPGLSYKAVVALSSNSMLSNVTIHGHYVNGAACVGTTDGFQSRLTIERVGVSGSHYGFDLQTYLSTIVQCTANYNTIGFYIHGSYSNSGLLLEGTSINLSTCYAVDSKKTGYELAGITYSTLNNCAADGCGIPVNGIINKDTEIGYSYSFTQCKNITVNSCGAECCLGAVRTMNSKNIIFNSSSFLIDKRKNVKVAEDFILKSIINLRYSAFIEFNYPYVNTSDMDKYYTINTPLMLLYGSASLLPSVIINNGYEGIRESNIGTEGFLTKETNFRYK